jgi:hypothetical protein
MKRLSMLAVLAFARLTYAEPRAAEGPPATPDASSAAAIVQRDLVKPLAVRDSEQSRFSRARMPAAERRVRLLDRAPETDARGGTFFAFAIDERRGMFRASDDSGWRTAAVSGCVYVGSGEVFVKVGDRHRPAAFLLGKNLKPVAEGICQGAPAETASAR